MILLLCNFKYQYTILTYLLSEPVWGYLKKKIHERKPKNKDELWQYAQEEWKKIPTDYIRKLCYDNYKNRVKAVIESKGEVTKY